MIHAVWISGGRARYRNRWIWTNGLRAEERAGRALYGGIMTPAFVDQGLLGPDPDPGWPIDLGLSSARTGRWPGRPPRCRASTRPS